METVVWRKTIVVDKITKQKTGDISHDASKTKLVWIIFKKFIKRNIGLYFNRFKYVGHALFTKKNK